MITSAQIKLIGQINKPHGIHGEMSATIECDIEELRLFKCIIFEIDGIFVPFFISTLRPRGSQSALISIDGVISDEHAAEFANKEIYALKSDIQKFEKDTEIISDDEIGIDDLIGYEIADGEKENVIGKIEMIDETTENMLFIVKTNSGEYIYIPIAEELILEVDCDNAIILMDLPQGLISVQSK